MPEIRRFALLLLIFALLIVPMSAYALTDISTTVPGPPSADQSTLQNQVGLIAEPELEDDSDNETTTEPSLPSGPVDTSPVDETVESPTDAHPTEHDTASPSEILNIIEEKGADALPDALGTSNDSHHTNEEPNYAKPMNGSVCPDDAPVRNFSVHAVQVDIVYNKYGQHDPNGTMYVLEENADEVRNASGKIPSAENESTDLIQPLTIRAHKGECVRIQFTNNLSQSASIHAVGLPYNISQSDGMAVGYNPASFAEPNETVNYTFYANAEGTHYFGDGTDLAYNSDSDGKDPLRAHGLFGALVVEPKNAKWIDPDRTLDELDNATDDTPFETESNDALNRMRGRDKQLKSGTKAIITMPNGPDHREFVIFYHDGTSVYNTDGSKPTWPNSSIEQSIYAINYRGDPMGARLREDCEDCDKPELFYSSWLHGDPGGGDLVFPTYVGDPVKFRLVGAQVEENHVHHLHGHRWKSEAGNPDSNTIDSQMIHPGETKPAVLNAGFGRRSARPNMTYAEAIEKGGAGYAQKSPGDYIFHCHLFPHYANGMWGIMRVNDKEKPTLRPLPDREEPPNPTEEDPGYPNFIPTEKGEAPPKPPNPNLRQPTALEESAINGSGISDPIVPGAPYSNPCPTDAPMRTYNITVIETNITYNNHGDYDDNAIMYALEKDVPAIKNGSKRPKPLAIRANVEDCITVNLTNQVNKHREPNEFSIHIHFVGFDVLGSDGVTLGYNYDEGVEPGEKIQYRWYADERGTIFFHDHLAGIENGMHGTQGALLVEPKNSTWYDPYTGNRIQAGTKAMVVQPNAPDFREQALFYQDFARTKDPKTGKPINGPFSNPVEDQGISAVNYANAPLYRRNDSDPAYAFSSWLHKDPQTPIMETYTGDPMRIRLIQGTFEEQHNFVIHGKQWPTHHHSMDAPTSSTQTIGVSEQFQFRLTSSQNDNRLPMRDYLYGSMVNDDVWTGMWGIYRTWNESMTHLQPLPDQGYPTTEDPKDPPDWMSQSSDGTARITKEHKNVKSRAGLAKTCPDDAPERRYDLVAFRHNISYNDYGDHDPNGIMFATEEQYEKIQDGEIDDVDPLVIRANQGDCLEIRLENELPEDPDALNNSHPHAKVPANSVADWENSNRISLHPVSKVQYSIADSDGAVVGVNREQTVEPGDKLTYRWYANKEGSTILWDMADIRSHRHHGAFGMLIVEPENSTWLDPETGESIRSGPNAIVKDPDGENFREFSLLFTDGMYIVNNDGTCPVPIPHEEGDPDKPCNQAIGDSEDHGFKGINYDSEPFARRFAQNDSKPHVFSSKVHGDPNTPVLRAYTNETVVFRMGQPADKGRGMAIHLSNHQFGYIHTESEHQAESGDNSSPGLIDVNPVLGGGSTNETGHEENVSKIHAMGVKGGILPGTAVDATPIYDAGGYQNQSGDYLLHEIKLKNYLEGGLWSIFRVRDDWEDLRPVDAAVVSTSSSSTSSDDDDDKKKGKSKNK